MLFPPSKRGRIHESFRTFAQRRGIKWRDLHHERFQKRAVCPEFSRVLHHIVPRTNHTVNAEAICARPTTPKPMPTVRKEARIEIGKSMIQTIEIKSSLALL